jgi:excisionase family DNA binding protein
MNLFLVKEHTMDETDLLTVHEVARMLRVDDTTVRRWIKIGALEAITLPHRGLRQAYRIRRATLHGPCYG